MNSEELKLTISQLATSDGVSGDEKNIAQIYLEMLKKFCPDAEYRKGNVIGSFSDGKENFPHILIDAHMDKVGFIVTDITKDGFLKFANVGGIDARLLPAQRVIVHGKKDIFGVVSTLPPHLQSDKKEAAEIKDLTIDTGYKSDELKEIVSRGDFISFDMPFKSLQSDFIASSAFDDRCSMAAILYGLSLLDGKNINPKVTVMFSSQEELGELGAKTGCEAISPDIALEFDVTFARTVDDKPEECGEFEKGALIGISPSLSREISNSLISVAKENDIPYQLEIMPGLTSTNADRFSVCQDGVKTSTVSIPLRYMHTPCEVINIKDVESTGRLLAAYIESFK
jgi:endoglucanase